MKFDRKEEAALRSMSNSPRRPAKPTRDKLSRLPAHNDGNAKSQNVFTLSTAFYVEHDTSNGYEIMKVSLPFCYFIEMSFYRSFELLFVSSLSNTAANE